MLNKKRPKITLILIFCTITLTVGTASALISGDWTWTSGTFQANSSLVTSLDAIAYVNGTVVSSVSYAGVDSSWTLIKTEYFDYINVNGSNVTVSVEAGGVTDSGVITLPESAKYVCGYVEWYGYFDGVNYNVYAVIHITGYEPVNFWSTIGWYIEGVASIMPSVGGFISATVGIILLFIVVSFVTGIFTNIVETISSVFRRH